MSMDGDFASAGKRLPAIPLSAYKTVSLSALSREIFASVVSLKRLYRILILVASGRPTYLIEDP
jgi:hypothetical protein